MSTRLGKRYTRQDDDDIYTVESIMDKKIENGEWKYLIKWLGWPKNQATWEPIENLSNVLQMVEEFEKKWPEGKLIQEKAKYLNFREVKPNIKQKSVSKSNSPEKLTRTEDNNVNTNANSSTTINTNTNTNTNSNINSNMINYHMADNSNSKSIEESSNQLTNDRKLRKQEPKPSNSNTIPNLTEISNNKKVKLDVNSESKIEQPVHGHFKFGDKAKKIISAKSQDPFVICLIEWEPRPDGILPLRTNLTNKEIKLYDPMLLLEFYESRLKFGNVNSNSNHSVTTDQHHTTGLANKHGSNYSIIANRNVFSNPKHSEISGSGNSGVGVGGIGHIIDHYNDDYDHGDEGSKTQLTQKSHYKYQDQDKNNQNSDKLSIENKYRNRNEDKSRNSYSIEANEHI